MYARLTILHNLVLYANFSLAIFFFFLIVEGQTAIVSLSEVEVASLKKHGALIIKSAPKGAWK